MVDTGLSWFSFRARRYRPGWGENKNKNLCAIPDGPERGERTWLRCSPTDEERRVLSYSSTPLTFEDVCRLPSPRDETENSLEQAARSVGRKHCWRQHRPCPRS